MKLELFKTLWGHRGDLPSALQLARGAGFDGIEGPAPLDDARRSGFFAALFETPWIAEITTCTLPGEYLPQPHLPVETHIASLSEGLIRCMPGKPRFVTTMAGSDEWEFDDVIRFHTSVLDLEQRHGVAISVETHRGRPTFHPWQTVRLLKRLPDLKLTCDFSHWCVVCERLLLDQEPELLEICARHTYHIHGRVGYSQGPQVPDPRAPEYADALAAQECWWACLWDSMADRGITRFTMTPEFGPDGYLQCEPFTQKPVADLWEINRWIGLRQRDRFHRQFPTPPPP